MGVNGPPQCSASTVLPRIRKTTRTPSTANTHLVGTEYYVSESTGCDLGATSAMGQVHSYDIPFITDAIFSAHPVSWQQSDSSGSRRNSVATISLRVARQKPQLQCVFRPFRFLAYGTGAGK